jgi:hypothetical protein
MLALKLSKESYSGNKGAHEKHQRYYSIADFVDREPLIVGFVQKGSSYPKLCNLISNNWVAPSRVKEA